MTKTTMIILSVAIFIISLSATGKTVKLRPFVSDGCSSFPDGSLKQKKLWLHCCTAHDFDYWKGGTLKQRIASDKRLKSCVAKAGKPKVAALMLAGVRVGGMPYFPTPFRWGYGWPYPRFYGELSEVELNAVQSFTPENRDFETLHSK